MPAARRSPGISSGALRQPRQDFSMLDLASGDALDHRHIEVRLAPRSGAPLASKKRPVRKNAVRLLPSGNGWLRAKRSSRIAAFSKIVG
jgi:hypothetical protein